MLRYITRRTKPRLKRQRHRAVLWGRNRYSSLICRLSLARSTAPPEFQTGDEGEVQTTGWCHYGDIETAKKSIGYSRNISQHPAIQKKKEGNTTRMLRTSLPSRPKSICECDIEVGWSQFYLPLCPLPKVCPTCAHRLTCLPVVLWIESCDPSAKKKVLLSFSFCFFQLASSFPFFVFIDVAWHQPTILFDAEA